MAIEFSGRSHLGPPSSPLKSVSDAFSCPGSFHAIYVDTRQHHCHVCHLSQWDAFYSTHCCCPHPGHTTVMMSLEMISRLRWRSCPHLTLNIPKTCSVQFKLPNWWCGGPSTFYKSEANIHVKGLTFFFISLRVYWQVRGILPKHCEVTSRTWELREFLETWKEKKNISFEFCLAVA